MTSKKNPIEVRFLYNLVHVKIEWPLNFFVIAVKNNVITKVFKPYRNKRVVYVPQVLLEIGLMLMTKQTDLGLVTSQTFIEFQKTFWSEKITSETLARSHCKSQFIIRMGKDNNLNNTKYNYRGQLKWTGWSLALTTCQLVSVDENTNL